MEIYNVDCDTFSVVHVDRLYLKTVWSAVIICTDVLQGHVFFCGSLNLRMCRNDFYKVLAKPKFHNAPSIACSNIHILYQPIEEGLDFSLISFRNQLTSSYKIR